MAYRNAGQNWQLRLWLSGIICCHQLYLTPWRFGNLRVLMNYNLIHSFSHFWILCHLWLVCVFVIPSFSIPVSNWYLLITFSADLGHQTVQRIVHASDPLQSMQEINQNFPSIVSSLSRMKVKFPAFCFIFW